MKKLILIFGAFAIIFVIISSVIQPNVVTADVVDNTTATKYSEQQEMGFTVKSENGRIVVYEGDNLLLKTSTAVNTLPKKDQKTLLYGVHAKTREEVDLILQEFCS